MSEPLATSLADPQEFPGRMIVWVAGERRHPPLAEFEGLLQRRAQHPRRIAVIGQHLQQDLGHRIMAGQNHVATGARGQLAGGRRRLPRLDPRRIEKLDERERQQHQQIEHAGDHDDDRERPPKVRVEGDVAETQRGHHGQGPIESGQP
jgi:hypothetical protein